MDNLYTFIDGQSEFLLDFRFYCPKYPTIIKEDYKKFGSLILIFSNERMTYLSRTYDGHDVPYDIPLRV